MCDHIEIKRLEVFAKHGVLPEENVLGQKFVITADLFCDLSEAGQSDDLTQSVNYAQAAALLREKTEGHTFQLIERLAEYLAQELLVAYPVIHAVRLEVEKPWAPVHLPLETVSVTVERRRHQAYLSIGSNMGDKEANLKQAIRLLQEDPQTEVKQVSPFIVTDPVGGVEQDDFLNGAVEISTLRSPQSLLELIGTIEKAGKRERIIHWGPRTIDLDIILYDQEIIQTKDLIIPHKEMHKRAFVLEPMAQIAPYAVHPVFHKTMCELLQEVHESALSD